MSGLVPIIKSLEIRAKLDLSLQLQSPLWASCLHQSLLRTVLGVSTELTLDSEATLRHVSPFNYCQAKVGFTNLLFKELFPNSLL